MELIVLGCGGSTGVPSAAGFWGACDPHNPKNVRTRTSLAMRIKPHRAPHAETWLIDAGPDLRDQCLRENIERVDGVFLTHAHLDHVLGLNDLRPFHKKWKRKIPLYADAVTHETVRHMFGFLIEDLVSAKTLYPPFLVPHTLQDSLKWLGFDVRVFQQEHGAMPTMGYRFDFLQGRGGVRSFAYSTDVKQLSRGAFSILKGVDVWFVDCMAITEKPSHAHLEQTLAWIDIVRPKRAILIHMGAELDFASVSQALNEHPLVKEGVVQSIDPAFDGLRIAI